MRPLFNLRQAGRAHEPACGLLKWKEGLSKWKNKQTALTWRNERVWQQKLDLSQKILRILNMFKYESLTMGPRWQKSQVAGFRQSATYANKSPRAISWPENWRSLYWNSVPFLIPQNRSVSLSIIFRSVVSVIISQVGRRTGGHCIGIPYHSSFRRIGRSVPRLFFDQKSHSSFLKMAGELAVAVLEFRTIPDFSESVSRTQSSHFLISHFSFLISAMAGEFPEWRENFLNRLNGGRISRTAGESGILPPSAHFSFLRWRENFQNGGRIFLNGGRTDPR
eukprot:COSAG02_NODE_530_length_20697_cov_20.103457_10_plen_279_part_00